MRNHYRRLHGARCMNLTIRSISFYIYIYIFSIAAVDSKPPKAMVLGQKCRDRARKEMAQMAYTQNVVDQFSGGSTRNTPRGRSSQSARSRFVQSQVKFNFYIYQFYIDVFYFSSQQHIEHVHEVLNHLV